MKVLQGISPEELDGKLHTGQPDTPLLGTVGMQQLFDAHPNLNTEKINALVQAQNENNALVLAKNNTEPYTPTEPYHPATKKFVEDSITESGNVTPEQVERWDSASEDIAEHEEDSGVHIRSATASYDDGVFTLTDLPTSLPDIFTVRFKAPADFAEGDTFAIGSTTLTAKLTNQEPVPDELFKSGAVVTMEVDTGAETAFFKMGGGGFPDGWRDVRTAEAAEDIVKNDAISFRVVGDIADGLIELSQLGDLPSGTCRGASFSPRANYLAIAVGKSAIYERDESAFSKLPELPNFPSSTIYGLSFSPDGVYLAFAINDSPYLLIYKRSGNTFTKLANPSVLPSDFCYRTVFSSCGTYLVVTSSSSPYVLVYKRSGDVFTKLSNLPSLPQGTPPSASFAPNADYLAIGFSANSLVVYKRTNDAFSKISLPTAPTVAISDVKFSPDGMYLAVGSSQAPFLWILKREGDTFTELSLPSPLSVKVRRVAFSPDGNYLLIALESSPFLMLYKVEDGTFITLPDPNISLPFYPLSISFSPDGFFLAVTINGDPRVIIYSLEKRTLISPVVRTMPSCYEPTGDLGIALESASKGNPCKVNLFPALNEIGG